MSASGDCISSPGSGSEFVEIESLPATNVSNASNFENIDALMTLYQEETDRTAEATKEILWEKHFAEFGRGVSMLRTEEATKLVLKGIPNK